MTITDFKGHVRIVADDGMTFQRISDGSTDLGNDIILGQDLTPDDFIEIPETLPDDPDDMRNALNILGVR